jgi:hypothetical protein
MLTRRCGRAGLCPFVKIRPFRSYLRREGSLSAVTSSSVWITDEALRKSFLLFARGFSQSSPRCERLAGWRTRSTMLKRTESASTEELSASGWGDIPPTFSWSLGRMHNETSTLDGALQHPFAQCSMAHQSEFRSIHLSVRRFTGF